ncbi:hypothetical protein BJ508DRAFT_305620 [Ascobolus immersus RN42]|uniref:Uncharacterized protein n=1 Tax=Ascobolus immersus RN42 TaxID=1160509 RepID=A0A3N4IEA9_ASCIM|nr:hypothetical protein BJ508DRAFT_305620 [Ascobolus immersus RN42]
MSDAEDDEEAMDEANDDEEGSEEVNNSDWETEDETGDGSAPRSNNQLESGKHDQDEELESPFEAKIVASMKGALRKIEANILVGLNGEEVDSEGGASDGTWKFESEDSERSDDGDGEQSNDEMDIDTDNDGAERRDNADVASDKACKVERSMVKLLLDTKRVDLNSMDDSGKVPLSYALEVLKPRRHRVNKNAAAVVQLLRDAGAVDPEVREDDELLDYGWFLRVKATGGRAGS